MLQHLLFTSRQVITPAQKVTRQCLPLSIAAATAAAAAAARHTTNMEPVADRNGHFTRFVIEALQKV